ncbi:transforming acidic coiled-coil-containing protein 3 isoform X2 [Drosophila pseudoobscura]|uniref:Transforming acidic coiled-coil-containing protein 3 isoform X2 n=1 Tax=Drosophila pseudoobscura pseudoobscura TaxID=46245 RepID=A0A6I8V3C3_DROPS|nr:transforming acidic coiled-coil-containing protein 3 isoform X2 [Drosophila pseudoobscura]
MDFITNMIKRPLSIRLSDANSSSSDSGLSLADSKPKDSPSALASMAVHPVVATEDLLQLGDLEPLPSARESIQKLLLDVNVNLSQVSAHEMEHLQAMSAEMSPLAVKQSVRPSLEKQKVLATAMIIPPSEDLAIEPVAPRFGMFDEEEIPELAPLSVEMEAQLKADQSDADVFVECMSLNSEKFSCDPSELEAYSSALNDVLEQQLEQTVSDPLAGSIAHNTSYEPMDVDEINETMEMLKDVLAPEDHQLLQQQFLGDVLPPGMGQELYHRQQQSPQEGTEVPLEREQSQPQSMPVQEVPQLEKKVPEAEQSVGQCQKQDVPLPAIGLFQENGSPQEQAEQQLPAVDPSQEQKQLSKELEVALPAAIEPPQEPNQSTQEKTAQSQTCQETEQLVKALTMDQMLQEEPQEKTQNSEICQLHDQKVIVHPQEVQFEKQEPKECPVLMNSSHISMENEHEQSLQLEQPQEPEIETEQVVPSPAEEHLKKPEEPAVAPLSPPIPTLQANRVEYPISPPIPTHRPKTAEELMFLALKEFPLSANEGDLGFDDKATVPEEKKPDQGTVVAVTPSQLQQTTKPLSQELDSSFSNPKVLSTGPNSPSFPIKGPTEQSAHFPRSPHAPAERKEMSYLEEAVIESTAQRKLSICEPGVIAKSPVIIQVSQPSPEQRHLNETLPMGEVSPEPQDVTFDSGKRIEHSPQNEDTAFQDLSTFAVSLGAADDQQRRTFSVIKSTEDQQEAGESKSRRTFSLEKDKPRRTFCVEAHASPAVEATEESMGSEDYEAMDVDVSVQVEEATTFKSPRTPAQVPSSPPIPTHQNLTRPPIHVEYAPAASRQGNAPAVVEEQALSAKEQAHLSARDEKDVFVEYFGALSPVSEDMFKTPQYTSSGFNNLAKMKSGLGGGAPTMSLPGKRQEEEQFSEDEFQDAASNTKLILNSSDFDYLYTKGNNNAPVDRSSLLLKFDPLLGAAVPVNRIKKHAKMSVDVIDNDCNKAFDNFNLNTEDKSHTYNNMDELEKKIKNEVTLSEDIEKKLKDAEQREEALIKRITEKDKINSKLTGVIETYEKVIAELISEKEQLRQNYETQLQEVQTSRDANYHHLTSLETTFFDLHVKYEKSKEMTSELKNSEDTLLKEKKQLMENVRLQEQRYEKMRSHAMQQLEIANKKLDTNAREHADEVKKLKALLKKEEVSRVSTAEHLQQKSRENADLLKICEELIYGKGQDS